MVDSNSTDSTKIDIWFVDFGNFEEVPQECVRAIKPEWLQLPVQQYIAILHGIELVSDSLLDQVLGSLRNYCGKIKQAVTVAIDPLVIKLYEEDGTLSYQPLLDHGLLVAASKKSCL